MLKTLSMMLAAGHLLAAGAVAASAAEVQVNRAAKADRLPLPVAETVIIKTEPASFDVAQ
jgi:hypothetical protein